MGVYYNADGNLQEFESVTEVVTCKKCGKKYEQTCEEQVPGFRMRDEDVCPYCHNVNQSSMSYDYFNKPLPEDEQ